MSGEWNKVIVNDIASSSRNALVGGPFGSNLVSKDYVSKGVPVIRGQNMGERWLSGEFVYITEEKANSLAPNLARPGDLIFTQRGTLGQVAIVPKDAYDVYLVSQSQMKLTVNTSIADPLFFYYVFRSPEQMAYIDQNAIRVGVPHTNLGILRNTPVQLPPLKDQKNIAQILGTLDDKIELNRQINQTLEAMAQALFKSWFVDFDPVRAKVAALEVGEDPIRAAMRTISGKTDDELDTFQTTDTAAYAQLQTTASLFPNEFEGSDLGMVPKGWTIQTVGAALEKVFSGGTPDTRKANYWNGNLPWFSSGETRQKLIIKTEKFITQEGVKESSTKLSIRGDILIASAGQGYTRGQTSYNLISTYINQSVVALRTNPDKCSSLWLFQGLSNRYEEMRSLSDSHSSRGSLTTKLLAGMPLILPQKGIIDSYTRIAESYLLNQEKNEVEILYLSKLRDTLLPKLLSGELSVSKSEVEAEAIG